MNAILLDDEPLALRSLEHQLKRFEGVNIIGTFSLPAHAVAAAEELQPDVAFIDIDMPEMNGIQVAEKLQTINESMVIVFVTAYDEYAVKAFELNALDYVLKPVQPLRLKQTVDRLQKEILNIRQTPLMVEEEPEPVVRVQCAGTMNIFGRDGEPLSWRTSKSRELFAYLVYKRGQPVRKEALLELLWPDSDEKKGFTHMYTTIYRLRKTFEGASLNIRLLNSGDGYWLRNEGLQVDTQEWEEAIGKLPPLTAKSADDYQRRFDAYPGDYLCEHDYIWSQGELERLRSLCYRHGMELCRYWTNEGFSKKAVDMYERLLQQYPYSEEIYEALIEHFVNEGQHALAQQQYDQLAGMMCTEYDSQPSESAKRLLNRIHRVME
ncbi:response regulator [Paenibacillus mendelii]|uniref:Response regulator n=1 Tax=Paenibacillus mendelii TaxID=206163 RepID=A0ABV6JLV3_9BACL|nr:response regulator [Paenibacillus mendelii]MCQ6560633.1 response regulator [Paenibacillus mendelii]